MGQGRPEGGLGPERDSAHPGVESAKGAQVSRGEVGVPEADAAGNSENPLSVSAFARFVVGRRHTSWAFLASTGSAPAVAKPW